MPARQTGFAIILCLLLSVFVTAGLVSASTIQAQDINVYINGVQTLFPDQLPYIDENDRTMVPVRFCSLALGASVDWNAQKMQVTISRPATASLPARQVALTINSTEMLISGEGPRQMDTAAVLKNERTMVPLRFISEFFAAQVVWDEPSRSAHVFTLGQSPEEQEKIIKAASTAGAELPRLNSAQNLQRLLDEYGLSGNGIRTDLMKSALPVQEQAAAPAPAAAEHTDGVNYSGTNVQVQGVDESDIVKTDGEYLYQVKNYEIIIVKAYPANELKVIARIPLLQHPREMYIDHNQLILIQDAAPRYDYPYPAPLDSASKSIMPPLYPISHNRVLVTVYDTSDKANPVKTDEFGTPGAYLSSRKIDNSIYVISNENVYQPFEPVYSINGQNYTKPYDQIRYFPDMRLNSYVSIAQVRLSPNGSKLSLETFLGSSENVYCSTDNLYVAASHYRPSYYREGLLQDSESTVIYKFALGGGVRYVNRGLVPGSVLNQFSMDEYEGYFRIATTNQRWSTDRSSNAVYILNADMKQSGAIQDIAPGERIYSARFMGPRAYLVTFKQVDPLFVIDMNPADPKILGKLKIPGFSNYLHPYGEHFLIGLGSEVETVGKATRATGLKLSLFDVADVNNPIEVDKTVIGTSGTFSEATGNHKALMIYDNLLAFPATVYQGEGGYSSFEFQGAYVYNVSPQGFILQGRITHLDQQDYLKAGDYWGGNNREIRRVVCIGGNLYTLSEGMIKASQNGTLSELNCILTD
jgi:uncharacterized secreted protein with C-terminal beta-propeller domain